MIRLGGTWLYLVAYTAPTPFGYVVCSRVVTRDHPVDSVDEFRSLLEYIESVDDPGAVITNIVLLRRRRFARLRPNTSATVPASPTRPPAVITDHL